MNKLINSLVHSNYAEFMSRRVHVRLLIAAAAAAATAVVAEPCAVRRLSSAAILVRYRLMLIYCFLVIEVVLIPAADRAELLRPPVPRWQQMTLKAEVRSCWSRMVQRRLIAWQ